MLGQKETEWFTSNSMIKQHRTPQTLFQKHRIIIALASTILFTSPVIALQVQVGSVHSSIKAVENETGPIRIITRDNKIVAAGQGLNIVTNDHKVRLPDGFMLEAYETLPNYHCIKITNPGGPPELFPYALEVKPSSENIYGGALSSLCQRSLSKTSEVVRFRSVTDSPLTTTLDFRFSMAVGPYPMVIKKPVDFQPNALQKMRNGPDSELEVIYDDRPALRYQDKTGQWHTDYFLPENVRLGDISSQIVAIDRNNKVTPLFDERFAVLKCRKVIFLLDTKTYNAKLRKYAVSTNPVLVNRIPLGNIKELRLQIRPIRRVEFKGLPIVSR